MNAQLVRIPRRADFIRVGIWIGLGLAVLAIIEVEMFWRYVRLLEGLSHVVSGPHWRAEAHTVSGAAGAVRAAVPV